MRKLVSAPIQNSDAYLAQKVPALEDVIRRIGPLPKLKRRRVCIPDAIVRITIGQMLSGAATNTIYERVKRAALDANLANTCELPEHSLIGLGISRRKARTITEFSAAYKRNPKRIERWKMLDATELISEVNTFWGLSDWSASMLGIFHFGLEDIFPAGDGSIQRALLQMRLVPHRYPKNHSFAEASPLRSYLALYLWKALDEGVI